MPRRLALAHLPTPVTRDAQLSELFGIDLWIKRDDATGGAEAGNKIRKLEFLLAEAIDRGARHVVTCGGVQSNHARATAICARRLGLETTLLLRVDDEGAELPTTGNVLLDMLVGAKIRTITREQWAARDELMAEVAAEVKHTYVIPEGGSNGLGALGYVEAMRETRAQAEPFDVVVHACGSGGTAAGVALGCAAHGTAKRVLAIAVCDDAAYFEGVVARIVGEARALVPELPAPAPLTIDDHHKGPRYGVMSDEQLACLVWCGRNAGLVLDPVYTGKAMFALRSLVQQGHIEQNARVLFVHTGGLPGLLAESAILA